MQTKYCAKCDEHKPFPDFSKNKARVDGIQDYCRECCAQAQRQWRETNRDKVREFNRQYREANRDKILKIQRQYRKTNREKLLEYRKQYRETNPEKMREYSRKYREANLDKRNALEAKRRAAKMQRTPSWLTLEHLDEIETFYAAAIAFRIYTGQEYHVDHIVPLQGKNVSGLHVPWNLQVLPKKENLKKGNK
jgi:hypothetical protein